MRSIHDRLKDANVQIGHWHSDLYFEGTPKARKILAEYVAEVAALPETNLALNVSGIGNNWLEIPFAYEPWWQGRKED